MVISRRLLRLKQIIARYMNHNLVDIHEASSYDVDHDSIPYCSPPHENGTAEQESTAARDSGTPSTGRLLKTAGKRSRLRVPVSKSGTSSQSPDEGFESLDINAHIVAWLKKNNITSMTHVQKLAIPKFIKSGNDVLVQSHTGSGKTLCFVIPMLDIYLKTITRAIETSLISVFSVIILPTRELATQVHSVVSAAGGYITKQMEQSAVSAPVAISCLVLIGGCPVEHDIKAVYRLKDNAISRPFVIATPGRLRHMIDALQQEMVWTFKELAMLVLDEADRLLEMGYQTDMTTIMGSMPKQRKTGFFSATLPSEVLAFAKRILRSYHFINADNHADHSMINADGTTPVTQGSESTATYATPRTLNNFYILLDPREKLHFLVLLLQRLKQSGVTKCAIFFLTCDLVDYFSLILPSVLDHGQGTDVRPTILYKIHRKMPTAKRQQNLDKFRKAHDGTNPSTNAKSNVPLQVMLCTDVFSRGIDIPQIEWVIQYDAPQDPNFYVHRIGRVSRAGAAGNALLLLNDTEESYVQFQVNRKIPLTPLPSDILDGIKCYYDTDPQPMPHVRHSHCTTVANGRPYLDFLAETAPEQPTIPWNYTCQMLSFLRSLLSKDRSMLLTATKAFVSYTRAYSEHRLKSIFEKKKVDYGGLATSFGVLKVPRVKEILGKALRNFSNSDLDTNSVPFTNEEQEQQRLLKLQQPREVKQKVVDKPKPAPVKAQRTRSEKRNAKRENLWREWEELAREESLAKKLRRGKITKEQYERLLKQAHDEPESSTDSDDAPEPEEQHDESDWERYRAENFVPRSTPPPRMVTGSINVPVTRSTGQVFRRQNTASRLSSQTYQGEPQPFKAALGPRAPMMMPRRATASVMTNTPGRSQYDQFPTTPHAQRRTTVPNIRTVVLPQNRQATAPSPVKVVAREKSPTAMPRQSTGMSRKSFVPSSYVSKVYPSYNPPNQVPTRVPTTPMFTPTRNNTAVFSRPQQPGAFVQPRAHNHIAFRGRNHSKGTSAQRKPSVFNDVVTKLKEHASSLPTVEAKEAAQLLGGFVSGTISVLAHIVGDIRGDIINGLFKPEDPSYDAAKAYYYSNNNHPSMPTGMTQRIDYIEEIEKCMQARSKSRNPRGAKKAQPPPQPRRVPEPPTQPMYRYQPAMPTPQHNMGTTFGQDPNMFSMMSERTLEEFLLNDGYLNSAPPSMPR
ncbi:ATP-dependent RNA helicase [Babesia ovis]|uniref:ATP-dependent RNA helicase n=1 Tax=Babesia ovis TaxID=5869 RepID=A0A9W5T8V9_BABOV|nr:ATP-dependent RNA helicase [Babesia ovis]